MKTARSHALAHSRKGYREKEKKERRSRSGKEGKREKMSAVERQHDGRINV